MSTKNTLSKKYTNGEITIVWKPGLCIHSANCVNGLPGVFEAGKKPWINPEGATSEAIAEQVGKCPSGALTYYWNAEGPQAEEENGEPMVVEVSKDGPILVHGNITLKHSDGSVLQQKKITALCRCGVSSNKPFCDGSHRKAGFKE